MQETYGQSQRLQVTRNILEELGHTVVLFSSEKLNLTNKRVGIQMIEARHFVFVRDQTYRVRDETEAIFTADPGQERGFINYTKAAHKCAMEVMIQHASRGVGVIAAFDDVPIAKIEAFEKKLAALGWFEVPQLQQLLGILEQVQPSDEMEQKAAEELFNLVQTGISHRLAKLDDSIMEAEQSKKDGGIGRSNLTRDERSYYAEIGVDLPNMLSQPVQNIQAQEQQTAQSGSQVELIGQVASAIAEPMADMMNQTVEKVVETVMERVMAKFAQKGETTDGEQKEKRGPGRPPKAPETASAAASN